MLYSCYAIDSGGLVNVVVCLSSVPTGEGNTSIVNEELLTAIRLVVREEVGASEHRTIVRFDRVDERLDKMDERFDRVEKRLDKMDEKIEDIKQSHLALENKVDLFQANLRRDMSVFMKKMEERMDKFQEDMKRFANQMAGVILRVEAQQHTHENTPINKTYPPTMNR